MKTTIDLDHTLIDEVVSLGGFHSARDAVSTALSEYAKLLKRRRALDLYGTVEWQGNLTELRSPREESAFHQLIPNKAGQLFFFAYLHSSQV